MARRSFATTSARRSPSPHGAVLVGVRPSDAITAGAVAEQPARLEALARRAGTEVPELGQCRRVDAVGVVLLLNLDRYGHASQQVSLTPSDADPPVGAVQCAASDLIAHRLIPCAFARQQVTASGLPQTERAKHLSAVRRQKKIRRSLDT